VLPGRRIQLGLLQYGVASEIIDDEHGGITRLLELMDGTRDIEASGATCGPPTLTGNSPT
jgi:hypothetical protein